MVRVVGARRQPAAADTPCCAFIVGQVPNAADAASAGLGGRLALPSGPPRTGFSSRSVRGTASHDMIAPLGSGVLIAQDLDYIYFVQEGQLDNQQAEVVLIEALRRARQMNMPSSKLP